jgi:hypothetical protein
MLCWQVARLCSSIDGRLTSLASLARLLVCLYSFLLLHVCTWQVVVWCVGDAT